jgi:hypothetical protein
MVRDDSLALVRSFAAQIDAIITKVKAETAEDPACCMSGRPSSTPTCTVRRTSAR